MLTRRQFLKAGLLGSVALAAVGSLYWARQSGQGRLTPGGVLGERDRVVVAAITPVILDDALPAGQGRGEAVSRVVGGVDRAVAGLAASAQGEIGDLFALLGFPPTRALVAGIWRPWDEAGADEIAAFLESWRNSRLGLLRSGYAALHDLVLGAWYAAPEAWAAIDYPGPPEVFR
jgi:hypothetical protein